MSPEIVLSKIWLAVAFAAGNWASNTLISYRVRVLLFQVAPELVSVIETSVAAFNPAFDVPAMTLEMLAVRDISFDALKLSHRVKLGVLGKVPYLRSPRLVNDFWGHRSHKRVVGSGGSSEWTGACGGTG